MTETIAPADTLLRASALIRQRAEAATGNRWRVGDPNRCEVWANRDAAGWDAHLIASTETRLNPKNGDTRDAEHVASWHPDAALAAAGWLEFTAERHQPTEIYTVASMSLGDSGGDSDTDFIRRVELGSRSIESDEAWTEHVVEDEAGNIVASDSPPVVGCTHRPQDETWPCPEILPALNFARAYLGE